MFKARVCFPRGTFQTNLWPDSFGKNRFESRVFDYNRDFDWSSRQISPKNQDLMVQSTSKPTFFEIHSFSFKKTRAVYYLPWDHLVRSVLYVDIRFILLFSPSFSYGNVQKWYQVSFWGDNYRNTQFPFSFSPIQKKSTNIYHSTTYGVELWKIFWKNSKIGPPAASKIQAIFSNFDFIFSNSDNVLCYQSL